MVARIVPVLVALCVVVSACGGGDDEPAEDSSPTSTSVAVGGADESNPPTTVDPSIVLAPPTTRGPAPVVTVEPVSGATSSVIIGSEPPYRGILGNVQPDRYVVAPVALPPAPAEPGIAPLTGLPLDDADVAERPAIIAKLDNTEKGRPQEALALADIVYVEQIEGGFTRLVAVYHSHTPEVIGPVRSGRTTDIALFRSLNDPIFVWSGANAVHSIVIRNYEMVNMGAGTRNEYFRSPDRPGTYDLMTEPTVLWSIVADREDGGAPPPHFEYRDETIGLPPTAVAATGASISYPSVAVDWSWDASARGWRRAQDGTAHIDAQDVEVLAANVMIAEVQQVSTGATDAAGARVYEEQFLGSGKGWVLTDGHLVEVTWTKPALREPATWTTPDGIPVALVPGQTWVELVPSGSVVTD